MSGFDMKAGEPAAASGVGVDADGVSEIKRNVGFLCGVAADHDLAGLVGLGSAEFFVDESEGELLIDRSGGLEIGVHENVGVRLVVGLVAEKELPVGFRHVIEAARPVGLQGGSAAPGFQPVSEIGVVDVGEEELFLMIAREAGDVECLFQVDDEVDNAFGIGAAVDVVADEDEVVFGLRGNDFD